ncbi:hypothetical protein R0G64_21405 [Pseudomonas otitidis]|uniref:Uncharacterized protein n=1 Tax=Metapseudomonas otitidis TaxID=319939 RepID=A0ABU3XW30_9GAMM|nr:hypothetical protein [Pseudomonas otitidis]MDV3441980.1 hypothetical protein [Pseudomonas otitidis]MEE1891395.1 hypothetical protein [Pseudomonas otitidis]WMR33328.1 hypothetical protein QT513_00930 [Pseudomonas otitidis]
MPEIQGSPEVAAVSDDVLMDYLERQLRSGRVKVGVLMVQFEKAFPGVERDRLVRCFNALESRYLKR